MKCEEEKTSYSGVKALIMGLGVNGGGLASARYLASRGADLTVTDLRDEKALAPSLEQLRDFQGIRYVLGRHETADFENADMVVKNPGVRPDSPYLRKVRRVETDISLFLDYIDRAKTRLTVVTGSKGKSGTASAIHWVLQKARERLLLGGSAFLGGNITVSPLTFLDAPCGCDSPDTPRPADALQPGGDSPDDVVLELSSWQLGDLKGRIKAGSGGEALLKPRIATLTAILPDHLDRYENMEAYVADKRVIYQGQDARDVTVAYDDSWGRRFLSETHARKMACAERPLPDGIAGGWLSHDASAPAFARLSPDAPVVEIVSAKNLVLGFHQKKNLLAAGLSLLDLGLPASFIAENLSTFPGIEHRLEFFFEKDGVRFYNDTAATIPEAAAAAVDAFSENVVLLTGGADKQLDFTPLAKACAVAKKVVMLAGTGSVKLQTALDAALIPYAGPYGDLNRAVADCFAAAAPGDVVLLSPGCASFGMFQNEFDRGRKWKEAVRRFQS
ncbi:MAG: UDP-N-acetylmuramoyl-L-alanine--D-glutamate ligase [Treponema sp.]|jgi:UDP-N-acetylmuramoylalanine--D-glutamate ligase|nr:UDP-N-acetylmuramoyl-L-alanine--D-glutamate ligase [Treponema sp.]